MNKDHISKFLIQARSKTYAGESGKVKPAFEDSNQLEFIDGDWFYRDVYNNGNGIFVGLETVYFKEKVVWSMSYYGNYKKLTEEEIDKVLRKALIEKKYTARLWNDISYESGDYKYTCVGYGSIDELGGTEKIFKGDKEVYFFYYAGGVIAE